MKEVSLESKTLAPIRILEILELYSDENHLLTHDDILQHLDREYNIILERKSIGRHIQNLINANYDIVVTKKGSYIGSRDFDNSELRVLIDNVLFSNYISETHAQQLIKKLRNMGDIAFRNQTRYVHDIIRRNRTKSPTVFYLTELIGEAIEKKKRISFVYNRIIEKDLQLEPWVDEREIIDPFYLVAKNGWYYLIGVRQAGDSFGEEEPHLINFRLDKITDLHILNEDRNELPENIQKTFNLETYLSAKPFMLQGDIETFKFEIIKPLIQDVIDDFGKDVQILEEKKKTYIVSFKAGRFDGEEWAMRNGHYATLLEPKHRRARIAKWVKWMYEEYQN